MSSFDTKKSANLDGLKEDIEASIRTVKDIPKITTDSFSSESLKAELIPILEEGKSRISNIEDISKNIDAVRNEIINPVNKIIEDTSRPNLWFSLFSIFIGLVGVILTINSYFVTKNDINVNKEIVVTSEEIARVNNSIKLEIERLKEFIEYKKEILSSQDNLTNIEMHKRSFIEKFYMLNKNHVGSIFWGFLKIFVLIFSGFCLGMSIYFFYDMEEGLGLTLIAISILILPITYFFI